MDPYYTDRGGGGGLPSSPPTPAGFEPHHFISSNRGGGGTAGAGGGVISSPASDKARLGELAFLKSTLRSDGFFLPADWEESVLGTIASGLRHGNSQVCLQALDCLLALIPQLRLYELTPHAKGLCLTLGEALGDSRPSVRERTQEALGLVAAKVGGGPAAVLEGLGPALQNARNARMRQEATRCLGRLASGALVPELDPEERRLLVESLASLVRDDPSPDVQVAAQTGLTHLLTQESAVVGDLEALGLPRSLLQQLAAGAAPTPAAVATEHMPPPPPPSEPTVAAPVVPAPAPPVPAPARRAGVGAPPPPGRSNEKEAVVTEHVEGVVEVVPLQVHSERELMEEMESVASGLLASEEQWQARVEALQRLQQLAVGGAGSAFEHSFISGTKALHEAIAAQVCSLRSALSREGMVTVAVLAQALGEAFAPLADCWLPALLRMAQSNTLFTALSADQTLRCVVACTRQGFPRLLPPLLEGAAGALKNDAARLRCVNAVTLALWRWEEAAFERCGVDGVARMIKAAVADKKEPVRAAARQCFWAFHRQFPSAATALLDQGLDAARARMLKKEQATAATPAVLDALVPARRYKVVSHYSQPSRAAAVGAHANPGASSAAAQQPPPPPSGLSTGALRAAAPAAPAAASTSTTTTTTSSSNSSGGGGARRQSLGPLGLTGGSGPLRVASAPPAPAAGGASSSNSGGEDNKPPAHHRAGAPQRVAKPNALPRPGGAATPAAASSSEGGEPQHKPAATGPAGGSSSGRLSMSGPLRVMRQPPGTPRVSSHKEEKPAAGAASEVVEPPASGGGAVTDGDVPPPPPSYPKNASGWESLLRGAESSQWHERLRCLEEARARLRDFNGFALLQEDAEPEGLEQQHGAGLSRVVSVLARHLHDGNSRVAQAAMEGVGEALRLPTPGLVALAVAPHLDQLLPRILARTADPKEQLRAAAVAALDGCKAAVEPGLLCAALARTLSEQGDRPKAMALEALRATLPRAGPTYLTPSAAKSLLARLAALLTPPARCPVAVERGAVGCLQALFQALEPLAFAHALVALATEPQLAVRRALAAAGTRVPPPASGGEEEATTAAVAPAPRPRARSQSFGGGMPASSAPMAAAYPSAPVGPPLLPKHPRGGAGTAPAMVVGDENSAPAGMPLAGGNREPAAAAMGVKKAKARTPAADPSPSSPPRQMAPEAAAPWALGVLADAAAPPAAKSRALDALAEALNRGGPSLWERHFGAALHLFLDGVKQWQMQEEAAAAAAAGNGASSCALLQPVPALGGAALAAEEEAAELDGNRNGDVWASAVKPASARARTSPDEDSAGQQTLRLSLRGLRYLVRLARRQQHGQELQHAFDAYLEVTAGRLLDCAATPDYEAFQSAERSLALLLLLGVDPRRAFAYLVSAATSTSTASTTPRLLMALRALTKLLPRVPPATAAAALPSLCPLLVQAVADPEIVVRMTSVACIAALFLVVRDALLPHLHARLRPVHLKLVTIYIKRADAAARAPAAAAAAAQEGMVVGKESVDVGVGVSSMQLQQEQQPARPALAEVMYNGR